VGFSEIALALIFVGIGKRPRAKARFGWILFPRTKGRCYSEEQKQKQKQIPCGNDKKKNYPLRFAGVQGGYLMG